VQKSAVEVRALVPQLLQSLGNVASALGSPGIEGMTRHLERFELTPRGSRLAKGSYVVRLLGVPVGGGPATTQSVPFLLR
jgi:hypothetical protein